MVDHHHVDRETINDDGIRNEENGAKLGDECGVVHARSGVGSGRAAECPDDLRRRSEARPWVLRRRAGEIVTGTPEKVWRMTLDHVLVSDGALILRYLHG